MKKYSIILLYWFYFVLVAIFIHYQIVKIPGLLMPIHGFLFGLFGYYIGLARAKELNL